MGVVDGARGREEGMQRQCSHRRFAIDSKKSVAQGTQTESYSESKVRDTEFMRGMIDALCSPFVFSISLSGCCDFVQLLGRGP